jgi:hypothetical protein
MKMENHARRFSMPPPGFVAANAGALRKMPSKPATTSPASTLAQIYDLARQQAVETVHRRQWNELVDRLFNS